MTELENGSEELGRSVLGVTEENKTHKGGQRHEGQRPDIIRASSDRRGVRGGK